MDVSVDDENLARKQLVLVVKMLSSFKLVFGNLISLTQKKSVKDYDKQEETKAFMNYFPS